MNLVRRLFPFRTCTIDIKDGERALARPCLLYHIKRCQGPCIQAISKSAYRRDIAQVELFLEGRTEALADGLRHEMLAAAELEQFERAAILRDKLRAIERTMESQKMAAFARTELDLVGIARKDDQAAVQLFLVRNGKMVGRDVFLLEAPRDTPEDEVVRSFLDQYYATATNIPREVLVPRALADVTDLEEFLTAKRGSNVRLRTPQRGEKRELMELATRNATETLAREAARWLADEGKTLAALDELGARARDGRPADTDRVLRHLELPGQRVGRQHGRVRGRPSALRRVPPIPDPDRRRDRTTSRATRKCSAAGSDGVKSGEEGNEEERRWSMPDLVIIDGGKGQVSAAKEVLDELGLHELPLAGLAKEREELFLPGATEPILLPTTSPALYLVQRLRDEAHRFAIGYHRQLRGEAPGPLGVR